MPGVHGPAAASGRDTSVATLTPNPRAGPTCCCEGTFSAPGPPPYIGSGVVAVAMPEAGDHVLRFALARALQVDRQRDNLQLRNPRAHENTDTVPFHLNAACG